MNAISPLTGLYVLDALPSDSPSPQMTASDLQSLPRALGVDEALASDLGQDALIYHGEVRLYGDLQRRLAGVLSLLRVSHCY